MRAWITVQHWPALIHFVLAVDLVLGTNPGIDISSSRLTGPVNFTSGSNYGGSPATATSTVTSSLLGNVSLTSVLAGPSTQTQSNISINPASFSPFPVPSDNPIPPKYPVVDPSRPPSVSWSFDFCWDWHVWTIFHRWVLLNFPISDLRGQPHTLRQRQRWGLPSLVLPFVVSYDGQYLIYCLWLMPDQCWTKSVNLNHWSCWLIVDNVHTFWRA